MKSVLDFLKDFFCDVDGNSSGSRLLSAALAVVSCYILIVITHHVVKVHEVGELGVWLANLPLIIAALVAFFTAPYGVNKASSSLSDIVNILRGKQDR